MFSNILICVCAIISIGSITVAKPPPPLSLAKVDLVQMGNEYVGNIQLEDLTRNLDLKKAGASVFGSNSRFSRSKTEDGEYLFNNNVAPTPQSFYNGEKAANMDSAMETAFKIHQTKKTSISLHGKHEDVHQSSDERNHVALRHGRETGSPSPRKMSPWSFLKLFVALHLPSKKSMETSASMELILNNPTEENVTYASPEVLLVFDHQQWVNLHQNHEEVMKYASVLINEVNARFATIQDLQINFKLVGVHVPESLSEQPFMEDSKIQGRQAYDIDGVFVKFNKWLSQKKNDFPKHDIAALVTGATLLRMDKDSLKHVSNIKGLALPRGACYESHDSNPLFKGIVVEDRGAFWRGGFTLAHELAHSLGAPHDGVHGAEDCAKSDGHIMSTDGWGKENKFTFSSCSRKLMKKFINSHEGFCLHEQSSVPLQTTNDHVGDILSMTTQCQMHTGRKDAYVDPNTPADELCKLLKCRVPVKSLFGGSVRQSIHSYPGGRTPCGSDGGKCWNGWCVKDKMATALPFRSH